MSKQARPKTQQLREAQREAAIRATRRRRYLMIGGVLLILGLIAAIVLLVVRAAGGDGDSHPAGEVTGTVVPPANLDASGAVEVGDSQAPVTVEIYYDYMCPACGAFEGANADELDRLLEDGTIRVALRPISFLDEQSQGTRYSTRAANAFATVVNDAPDEAWSFHSALYDHQPEEGTEGLSDDQIREIALSAGVPDEVAERFTAMTYEQWVASVTQEAFDNGVKGTPTVKIDGEPFEGDLYTAGPLTQAIEAKAAGS